MLNFLVYIIQAWNAHIVFWIHTFLNNSHISECTLSEECRDVSLLGTDLEIL